MVVVARTLAPGGAAPPGGMTGPGSEVTPRRAGRHVVLRVPEVDAGTVETSIRLGRIAGITVGLNWSVLVIAGLLCWGLAADTLPYYAEGYGPAAYWTAAVVAVGLFFASLVAHEFGHSLVARHHGVVVREITLWMLGGVAKLEGQSGRAADELRIAVAGPAVSVALGVTSGILAGGLELAGAPTLIVAVPAWLASINIILAVFNLIPAFPTDGGRVLRALLWLRSGDQLAATRTAASVGRMAGWGMVGLGVLLTTGGGGVGGVWFALIGLFLVFASGMEATMTEEQLLLGGLRVADVMTPHPITAPADLSVHDLLEHYVLRHHVSAYPLVDEWGAPVGLVTLAHVRRVPPGARQEVAARQVATPLEAVPCAGPGDAFADLLPRLASVPEGRALVLDRGRLVGIVSLADVRRAVDLAGLAREEGAALAPRVR